MIPNTALNDYNNFDILDSAEGIDTSITPDYAELKKHLDTSPVYGRYIPLPGTEHSDKTKNYDRYYRTKRYKERLKMLRNMELDLLLSDEDSTRRPYQVPESSGKCNHIVNYYKSKLRLNLDTGEVFGLDENGNEIEKKRGPGRPPKEGRPT